MNVNAVSMNRSQRRQAEKAARRAPPRTRPQVPSSNPLFALTSEARNVMGTSERRAMDALLEHRATDSDCSQIMTLIEASLRALRKTMKLAHQMPHLDPEALQAADRVLSRAGWAIYRARERWEQTGVYGLDAADRSALIEADTLVGHMRQPNVIQRKTWMAALREAAHDKQGVTLLPFEECQL